MKRWLLAALVAASALASAQFYGYKDAPVPGQARVATDATSAGVRVDQKLDSYIDLKLPFVDSEGKDVTLDEYFHKRPVVLLLVFYECAGVCTDELNNLVASVKGFKKDNVGDTFDVVVVSIDPREGPKEAKAKKQTFVDIYKVNSTVPGRDKSDKGWHFLTGKEEDIEKLASQVGFVYNRDPKTGNITHPASLMVLTPSGRLSRYFVTTEYPQQVLLSSIRAAKEEKIGVKDDRPFFLACVNVDPLTGQRSLNILNVVRTFGVLTVLAMATAMFVWSRKAKTANHTDGDDQ
ncbi:MAG: SCO family protein [Fimbriimonadaceae bacterium]|nr:SCO family protein [Fimbriimonadaceae bacterium]